jgi:homoserine kinase type II
VGVKTRIENKDLRPFIEFENIYETNSGVSDTVYIIDDEYAVKIFENSGEDIIQNEIEILDSLKELQTVKLRSKEIIYIKNKPSLIYKKCEGEILKEAEAVHIRQIGVFLKELHESTRGKISLNKKLFGKERLRTLIEQSGYVPFIDIFEGIDITLKDEGIIHGDLFLDNALFKDDELSCVIDFSEACNGDFLFDLAVAAISWCRSDQQVKLLLESYGSDIIPEEFKSYMRYALLYYSVTRYLDNRDYKELMEKVDLF